MPALPQPESEPRPGSEAPADRGGLADGASLFYRDQYAQAEAERHEAERHGGADRSGQADHDVQAQAARHEAQAEAARHEARLAQLAQEVEERDEAAHRAAVAYMDNLLEEEAAERARVENEALDQAARPQLAYPRPRDDPMDARRARDAPREPAGLWLAPVPRSWGAQGHAASSGEGEEAKL